VVLSRLATTLTSVTIIIQRRLEVAVRLPVKAIGEIPQGRTGNLTVA
jgi:hypothetical protein